MGATLLLPLFAVQIGYVAWELQEAFVRINFFPVILSEAKNLAQKRREILHFVQNDKRPILRMFLSNNS